MTNRRVYLHRLRFAIQALFAATVIGLGVLAGLTQLAVPWLEEHPRHVEHWLSMRLDRPVRIGRLGGAWVGGGPVLSLDDVVIGGKAAGQPALRVPHAELVFDLYSLFRRNAALTEFRISGLDLHLVDRNGEWQVRDVDLGSSGASSAAFSMGALGALEIRDLKLTIDVPSIALHLGLVAPVLRLDNRGEITHLAGRLGPTGGNAPLLDMVANLDINRRSGELYAGARDIDLARLLEGRAPAGIEVRAGHGTSQLWVKIDGGHIDDVRIRTDVADARFAAATPVGALDAGAVTPHVAFDRLAFVARWLRDAGGWTFDLADFTADGNPATSPGRLTIERRGDTANPKYRAGATSLPLEPLGSVLMLAAAVPPDLRRWLYGAHPRGALEQADLRWNGSSDYEVNALMRGIDIASIGGVPGIDHVNIDLHGDAGALLLHLPAQAVRIDYPHVFRNPFLFSKLGGNVIARRTGNDWRIGTDRIAFEGIGYGGELRGGVNVGGDRTAPFADLYAVVTHGDVVAAKLFWPSLTMPPQAIAWLDRALVGGKLVSGRVALRGDLGDWPFHSLTGRMIARGEIADLVLEYDPRWPRAEHVHAIATFVNDGMQLDANAGESMGNRISEAHATIADFGPLVLDLSVKGAGSGGNLLRFLRATPIGEQFEDPLKDLAIGGTANVEFTLNLPIKQIETLKLHGRVDLDQAPLDDTAYNLHFTDAKGMVHFSQSGFAADALDVVFRGRTAKLGVAIGDAVADPKHVFEATLAGVFPATAVFADVPVLLPAIEKFPGVAQWRATVGIDASDSGTVQGHLGIESDLRGLAIDLPAPLAKTADASLPFRLDLDLPYAGGMFNATLGDVVSIGGRIPSPDRSFVAGVAFGTKVPPQLPAQGIVIGGQMDHADAGGWLGIATSSGSAAGGLVRHIDVHVSDFKLANRHFSDMHVVVDNAKSTAIQFENAALAGELTIPDAGVAKGIDAKFTRIHWPETPPETVDTPAFADVAPATLPPLRIHVDDLRLGQANFGSADFDSHPVANGMRVEQLQAQSPNVTMHASGEWTGTAADNRSHLVITLSAQSLGRMLDALGFAGLIEGAATEAKIDATWTGPPTAFALPKLEGTLDIKVGEGRIPDVHPGAGRIFGLLSLTEIPRRLSLDFSDFFQSGFSFNSIVGKFRMAGGNAYTDGITIKSPAAEIVVTGRTGIQARDYDQQMTVIPHASSALPIVGAIAGGPVGAAAGLVVQGILRKPLGHAIAKRYHVTGSWDKPIMTPESATAAKHAPKDDKPPPSSNPALEKVPDVPAGDDRHSIP